MNKNTRHRVSYHTMTILAIIAGITGLAFQFMPDGEGLTFMLGVAVLGGLIAGLHRTPGEGSA